MSGMRWDGREWGLSARGCTGVEVGVDVDVDIRSVLHLAASASTPQAWSFFTILLKNQHTQINLQDAESGYTPLHRALFAGNIRAARELLARSDCDTAIRDSEGMTAFELYNGTVDGVSGDCCAGTDR